MMWWPIMRSRRWRLCRPNPRSGPSVSAFMRAWRTRACRWWDSSPCRIPSRPSPRSSGRFSWRARRATARVKSPNSTSSTTAPRPGRFMRPSVSDCCRWTKMATQAGGTSLADRKLARGHGWRHRDLAGAHPRISFRLALPGVRRIPREREREPPGGDATRRQKHRRIAGGPQQDIPSFAPEWHRRGTVRRHLRLSKR
jgi:hypothetical protein